MKKVLATVKPLHLDRWLIIALDDRWLDHFDGEIVFEASIADGHILIRSTKEVKQNE